MCSAAAPSSKAQVFDLFGNVHCHASLAHVLVDVGQLEIGKNIIAARFHASLAALLQ
jgi:hypothetical protein